MLATPFNLDERDAQGRAGGGPANAPIRDAMPEQHRLFFESLSYVGFATRGPDGWPEAALLAGEPGFIAGPEPSTLRIAARGLAVVPGQPVALLGIDFATRRRNRANGEVTIVGPEDGNRYYNTLGNLLGDARAALLFVGFDTGDLLQVRGRVTIDWAARPRRWTLQIDRVRRQRAAIPLRWSAPEPSGFLDSAGDWP